LNIFFYERIICSDGIDKSVWLRIPDFIAFEGSSKKHHHIGYVVYSDYQLVETPLPS